MVALRNKGIVNPPCFVVVFSPAVFNSKVLIFKSFYLKGESLKAQYCFTNGKMNSNKKVKQTHLENLVFLKIKCNKLRLTRKLPAGLKTLISIKS